jgi:hypothetical protein
VRNILAQGPFPNFSPLSAYGKAFWLCVVVDPFAPSHRLTPVFRNLTSRRRPGHFGLGAGPFLSREHHWYTNARYHRAPSPRYQTAYKLEVDNRGM